MTAKHLTVYKGKEEPRDKESFLWLRVNGSNGPVLTFYDGEEWVDVNNGNGAVGGASIIPITYSALKALRDNGELIPGQQYRITDYHTTTIQPGTTSVDHQFDIIVTADSESVLNENARCCLHEGDTYFSIAPTNLGKWQIKYSIDNNPRYQWIEVGRLTRPPYEGTPQDDYLRAEGYDIIDNGVKYYAYCEERYNVSARLYFTERITEPGEYQRYAMSVNEQGEYYLMDYGTATISSVTESQAKGVIYWMRDEFGNECPYDFKNIMFYRKYEDSKRFPITIPEDITEEGVIPYYTFSYFMYLPEFSDDALLDATLHPDLYVNNNTIGEYPSFDVLDITRSKVALNNNVIVTNTGSIGFASDIRLGRNCFRNTFVRGGYAIELKQGCSDNVLYDCESVTLHEFCLGNRVTGINIVLNYNVRWCTVGQNINRGNVTVGRNVQGDWEEQLVIDTFSSDVNMYAYFDSNYNLKYRNLDEPDLIEITYADLKALRDSAKLTEGKRYRITDYHTTTIQNKLNAPTEMDADTISADHQFDIIVTALSNNTLDESARCCLHEGDTYFTNYGARLEKWEIKYSLDNDWKYCWSKVDAFTASDNKRYQRIRFMDNVVEGVKYYAYIIDDDYYLDVLFFTQEIKQSGTYTHYATWPAGIPPIEEKGTIIVSSVELSNATGVIYYMKDEWDNECPYDFKNIMFYRKSDDPTMLYTVPAKATDEYAIALYTFFRDVGERETMIIDISAGTGVYRTDNPVRDNHIESSLVFNDYSGAYRYTLPNNVFNCQSSNCALNTIGLYSCGNTIKGFNIRIGNYCYYNQIMGYDITLGDRCDDNKTTNANAIKFIGSNGGNTIVSNSYRGISSIKIERGVSDEDLTSYEELVAGVTVAYNSQGELKIYNEADSVEGAVRYDVAQTLTDAQKAQARENIGASSQSQVLASIPSTGMLPNVMYALGEIAADPNITIASDFDATKDNEWMLTFETGAAAPASITFPSNVIFPDTPSFKASKHYEVSMKWDVTDSCFYALVQSFDRPADE